MQYLKQIVCFKKEACNIWCKKSPLRKKNGIFNAKSLLCECNIWCKKPALRKKNAIFDAKSLLCERRMQYLMQKLCFAKEECNIWCKKYAFRKKNAIFDTKRYIWNTC